MAVHTTCSVAGWSVQRDGARDILRSLPEETPVALVFNGTTAAVMMATPTDLKDFAFGFARTEGFIGGLDQVETFEIMPHATGIEARFWLGDEQAQAMQTRRRMMLGPVGCGLCGIDSLEQAVRPLPVLAATGPHLSHHDVATATDALRNHQPLHDQTHAVHAAGFLMPGQGIILCREDVGRHNALDKLAGALNRANLNAHDGMIVLTSRVSVEMVQKAAMMRTPVIVAISAPTALALRTANDAGITIAAIVRDDGFEIFTHPHRISTEAPAHVA